MAETNRGYMQQYAMLFGTYMGAFWIFKFIFFPLGLKFPLLFYLFIGLTICVPFIGCHYARLYRDDVHKGQISFFRSWVFTASVYVFAALLTSVAHYIYFRYIDRGFILDTYENLINESAAANIPALSAHMEQLKTATNFMRTLSPIDITMQMLSQNVFYGALIALPTAMFVARRKRKTV